MKNTLFILAFFTLSSAKSQTRKDNFIQDVYLNFIDTSVQKYNLLETAYQFPLKLMSAFGLVEELDKILPDSIVQSLLNNCKIDTSTHFWDKRIFTKAILVNQTQVDTLIGKVLLVKYAEESKRKYKQRKEELERKRGSVYSFSNPVFDITQKYTLICESYTCGTGCGSGCVYLFELNNGNWKVLSKMSCWIS